MRRGFAQISIGQVHYREWGSGTPLLMLHETPRSSAVFLPVADCLAQDFRVIGLDTPGFGESVQPTSNPGMTGYARYVIEFLDALGIEKTHLFGRHTGASIAVEVAARYPDRIDRLVLDGCPDYDVPTRAERLAGSHLEPLTAEGTQVQWAWDYADRHRHGRMPLDYISRAALDILSTAGRTDFGHIAVFEQDVRKLIPAITAPTLLLTAANDVFVERHQELLPMFQEARALTLDCYRHTIEELPAVTCRVLAEFYLAG